MIVSAAFAALTLAMAALWVPRMSSSPHARRVWIVPFAIAVAFALAGGLVDVRGVLVLAALAALCGTAARAWNGAVTIAAHILMVTICAGLFLHVIPGFDNPRVLTDVALGPGSQPYTKYLNFDKGVAGLFLLGIYAPDRTAADDGARHPIAVLLRFMVLASVAIAAALAAGYVRWDPKLPSWSPMWLWSMVFLTALPEEALFRGLLQTWIEQGLRGTRSALRLADARSGQATLIAILVAGTVFGIAHLGGGPAYIVLAMIAGIGYGWIYASTRSIAAAIAAHAALNTVHFLLFTYPALLTQ